MRRYILASHGKMAEGMKSSLEIILGDCENLTCINAYTDECSNPLPEFKRVLEQYPEDEIVIMTDLMGGSVNNNAMELRENPRVHVVTGTNLGMAISMLMSDPQDDTRKVVLEAVENAKNMVIYCNDLSVDDEEDDF